MHCFLLAVFLAAPGKIKAATVSEFNPEVNSVMPPPPKKVNVALRSLQFVKMCLASQIMKYF